MVVDWHNLKKTRLFCPEQKGTHWMKDLDCKFSRSGVLIVDVLEETFTTVRACLRTSQHHPFVRSEIDKNYSKEFLKD